MTLLVLAAVGILAALAIGDALRSGRSSSAPSTAPTTAPAPTTDAAPPPPPDSTPVREVARAPNTCGAFRIARDYPLLVVEVVSGNVNCHDARGVMKAHYVGLLSGSWVCHGPAEGRSTCEERSGEAVRAHFADALDDPEWEMERIANRWALSFASTKGGCSGHMTQPLCERINCERARRVQDPQLHAAHDRVSEVVRESEAGDRHQGRAGRGEVLERRTDHARWGRRRQLVGSQGRRKRAARPSNRRGRNGHDEDPLYRSRSLLLATGTLAACGGEGARGREAACGLDPLTDALDASRRPVPLVVRLHHLVIPPIAVESEEEETG